MDIQKVIIPAAGVGSRFLPFTKSIPKEMLPILNKPAIQYIVEECLGSDITTFCTIISKGKHALVDHFDADLELELFLKERKKYDLISSLDRIGQCAEFSYIRQPEPQGLGHAIWLARHMIEKEYFAVALPDDLIVSTTPALKQLIKIARQEKGSVIAVQEVPYDTISSYGVVGIKKQITPNLFQISHLVEKPEQKDAPSNLAIIGRYVLSHKLFPALETLDTDENGEIQLTAGIEQMLRNNERVFAYKVQGLRYDIGSTLGWLQANITCALHDKRYEAAVKDMFNDEELLEAFSYNPNKINEKLF